MVNKLVNAGIFEIVGFGIENANEDSQLWIIIKINYSLK